MKTNYSTNKVDIIILIHENDNKEDVIIIMGLKEIDPQ